MEGWNTTFKRPAGARPDNLSSPSPPRAHIEPLSPARPKPIEPQFNYPAVGNSPNTSTRPNQLHAATSKPRLQNLQQKAGHKRTPSTIDTLAEAALAESPSCPSRPRNSSASDQQNGHNGARQYISACGASEPPHKRARSELLPSPQVGVSASRPATSYEHGLSFQHHGTRSASHTYDSRVEDAALLLNFRTGGWPSNSAMSPPARPAQPAGQRPHANSFPRDNYHSRSVDASSHVHAPLLPPFSPRQREVTSPTASRQQAPNRSKRGFNADGHHDDRELSDKRIHSSHKVLEKTKPCETNSRIQAPTQLDETDSHAESTDIVMNEVSEPSKSRHNRLIGRSKPSSKKKVAEKVASKRAGARKKTTTKPKKGDASTPHQSESARDMGTRRKSMSAASNPEHRASTFTRGASVPVENQMLIRGISLLKIGRRQAKVAPETICAGCSNSRDRPTASSEMDEWISCNGCKRWFHIDCAGFKKAHEIRDIDKYFCATCEPAHGKTTRVRKSTRAHASVDYAELQRGVLKTSEESMEHHYIQPIKDGLLFPFDAETFPRMRPELVTRDFFERSGAFVEPICIPAEWNPRPWEERVGKDTDYERAAATGSSPEEAMADLLPEHFEYDAVADDGQDRLDMVMPEGLTVRQVCNLVGPDYPLDVIDVKTQNSGAKMNLAKWADYYEEESDEKQIRNVISLEVSQSKLGRLLRRPKIVRDIDLQDQVWPQEEKDKGKWPKVQYYCLMSIADSYTDFHIDFGGSSVYYHILKGKKTFFFIPPKPKHLKAYEEWNESPQQNYTFLGDITKECYRVDLHEGDTMLIPSGWIHAVWTPETSLVIGGNFLSRMSFNNQFKVVDIEKANKTPMKFRYPFFQKIMWYTALQYLQEDPLPPSVSQLFYEGKQFYREQPIWQDFDGSLAASDSRLEAQNSRYYSQSELDGLPEVAKYIFHTVMAVLGLKEGITADQMKRMNASIPKGHGEPLEVAKTFAVWVAWKRGNEPLPAWAHPDALLDHIKEEGPQKKLSTRAIRDLERKEANTAYRIVPDRQSERVMSQKAAAAAATNGGASPSPAPPPQSEQPPSTYHQQQPFAHQSYDHASPSMPPSVLMMAGSPGQYISTPKTSVLGPKRVACDTCRKRRIKCKHKDMVVQASSNGFHQMNGLAHDGSFQSNLAPELHENIIVTPSRPRQESTGSQPTGTDPHANGFHAHGENGSAHTNGYGPTPGTNAYINANIPMTMNGVPIFGDVPKRGRTKACYECRKSKRRCVHDEHGNVDPVKAAETPVSRATAVSKKRPGEEDDSPLHLKRTKSRDDSQPPPHSQAGTAGVLMPQPVSRTALQQHPLSRSERPPPPVINEPAPEPQQPEIDPGLFSAYPEPAPQNQYPNNTYPYPAVEHAHTQGYEYPSLEQIANEVLDMNGRVNEDYIDAQLNALPYQRRGPQEHVLAYHTHDSAPMSDSHSKPDGSVDSAVSLPNLDSFEQSKPLQNGNRTVDDRLRDALACEGSMGVDHTSPATQPSVEMNGCTESESAPATTSLPQHSPDISGLPLYRPPAPLSQSPEQTKRQPATTVNGFPDSARPKLREPSTSPNSTKAKMVDRQRRSSRDPSLPETEDERLAREMYSAQLGLRRRPSN